MFPLESIFFTPSRNRLNLTSELWGKSLRAWFLCCVKNLFNMLAQNVGIYFLICACVSFPINNLSDALLRNRKIRKCGFFFCCICSQESKVLTLQSSKSFQAKFQSSENVSRITNYSILRRSANIFHIFKYFLLILVW